MPSRSAVLSIATAFLMISTAICAAPSQGKRNPEPRMFGKSHAFGIWDLPSGRTLEKIQSLPWPARERAVQWLNRFAFPAADLEAMQIDDEGGVRYIEPVPDLPRLAPGQALGPNAHSSTSGMSAAAVEDAFFLHSRPDSPHVVYLDFDGHEISGTAWNSLHDPLYAKPFDLDGDPSTFNEAERAAVAEIWHRVAEDFAPFDIDVTTEEPFNFDARTGRVLITSKTDSNGRAMPNNSGGGVAYFGVWKRSNYATRYSPALVYYDNLARGTTYIAEASSHEFGHNLGLSHDGGSGTGYYRGHGSGLSSWAPIMGNSYYKNVTQWSKGEYANANNTQDDIAVIANALSLAEDDHSDSRSTATPLAVDNNGEVLVSDPELDPQNFFPQNKGIIEAADDWDYFSFDADGAVDLVVKPAWQAFERNSRRGANLDVRAVLLDADGGIVTESNPTSNTDATISATVAGGTHYLAITGVGSSNYSQYASEGQYFISGSLELTPNAPPTADFDFACSGLNCNFVDRSSDSDGSNVSWAWNFGDGSTSTAQSPSHSYTANGSYTVTLTVSDDDGASDSRSRVITVASSASDPDTVFSDDFADGDLAPWSQLQSGQVAMVNDQTVGWVMRKTTNNDPHGGSAALSATVSDFDLVLYARKVNTAGGNFVRYSLTDSSGNGYGLYLDYGKGDLTIERRSAWKGSDLADSSATLPTGMQLGQWYTLRLTRSGDQLRAEAYIGRAAPASATPTLTVDTNDGRFDGFTQVNVNGGHAFDTDDLRVGAPPSGEPQNIAPSANFSSDCTELACTFIDSSNDNDGSIVAWAWDFGNGSTSTIQQPSHSYTANGTYSVTLTVTDDDGATDTTVNTVMVSAVAGTIVFADDFTDGTLAPWSQLQSGNVSLVQDATHGWVLRKTTNNDPDGGSAPLGATVSDFDLVLYARKVNTAGGILVRYSVTDSAGNGYGLFLDYSRGDLTIERRTGWSETKLRASGASLPNGMQLGQWYTLRLTRSGTQLSAAAYVGRVDLETATPTLSVVTTDSVHTSFGQLNVNGGRDFDTDQISVSGN